MVCTLPPVGCVFGFATLPLPASDRFSTPDGEEGAGVWAIDGGAGWRESNTGITITFSLSVEGFGFSTVATSVFAGATPREVAS